MDKVYLVKSREFDCYPSIEKAFSNRIKAQAYIDEKMSWKKQLKEETGLDYDEWYNKEWFTYHEPMPNEMRDWIYKHSVAEDRVYFINELDVE